MKHSAPSVVLSEGTPVPGLDGFFDISNERYHELPGISSSRLSDIMDSPIDVLNGTLVDNKDPNADHFVFGSYLHEAIMFPDSYREKYEVFDGKVRRGKKWEEFKANCDAEGVTPVTSRMYEDCQRILEMIGDVPEHDALFNNPNNFCEVSTWVSMQPPAGLLCKCRPDVLTLRDDGSVDVIDIKTSPTAEFEIESPGKSRFKKGFKYSIRSYGYYRSQAFYTDIIERLGYRVNSFKFFVVGKDLRGNELYEISDEWVDAGRDEYKRALNKYVYHLMGGTSD